MAMEPHKGKLLGRIAVVTGASRRAGIGAAACRALAAEGADVFFTYWQAYDQTMPWGSRSEEVDELLAELRGMGVRAAAFEANLADPSASKFVMDEVAQKLGIPTILVNNAAHSVNDDYETLTAESLDAHYTVNVRNTALLSVEFARRFSGESGGRIINMTTGWSPGPMVGEVAYATTKGAVDALTVTLSGELAPRQITVNAVNPGPTDTGWMTPDIKQSLAERTPMGRVGMPQDAARLIAFLASDEAEWITGQVLHSTGGFR